MQIVVLYCAIACQYILDKRCVSWKRRKKRAPCPSTWRKAPCGKHAAVQPALMLTQVLEVLFNLSDVAIAGKFADYRALGAVGSTTLLVSLFTGLLIGMARA